MFVKRVFRWDRDNSLYRLFRVIWRRGRGPGIGYPDNYDAKFSVALCPPWWLGFRRESDGWRLWFLGLRLHHQKSYGGVMV